MASDRKVLEKTIADALSAKDAHVEPARALEELTWQAAGTRPDGAPHSVFQLLNHMIYWQEWGIKWLDGKKPRLPKHASASWPGDEAPTGPENWQEAVNRFEGGLERLKRLSCEVDLATKRGRWSPLEMLRLLASHNSYHLGQVVLLRRMLDAWPPPSGGDTW
jgi:uncharacterized damage-inducible protein DinB